MNPSPAPSRSLPPEDIRQIPKWTRAYAQNRSLGVAVFLLVFSAISALIAGESLLAGYAYRSGNLLLLGLSIALLLPTVAAVVYLSVPRWGGKLNDRLVQRLYADDGNVAFSPPSERAQAWAPILAGCFGACVLGSVVLGFVIEIPSEYLQPISALYVVPFLVALWILMRPMAGYAALLWPALYAAHAIGIVAGAPIVFNSPWDFLNLVIPMVGYGLLSAIVGHVYSRFALRRLRMLAGADPSDSEPRR